MCRHVTRTLATPDPECMLPGNAKQRPVEGTLLSFCQRRYYEKLRTAVPSSS